MNEWMDKLFVFQWPLISTCRCIYRERCPLICHRIHRHRFRLRHQNRTVHLQEPPHHRLSTLWYITMLRVSSLLVRFFLGVFLILIYWLLGSGEVCWGSWFLCQFDIFDCKFGAVRLHCFLLSMHPFPWTHRAWILNIPGPTFVKLLYFCRFLARDSLTESLKLLVLEKFSFKAEFTIFYLCNPLNLTGTRTSFNGSSKLLPFLAHDLLLFFCALQNSFLTGGVFSTSDRAHFITWPVCSKWLPRVNGVTPANIPIPHLYSGGTIPSTRRGLFDVWRSKPCINRPLFYL